MSKQIRVRLYGLVEIRVPRIIEVDYEEYREWFEEGGDPLYDITGESVIEFIESSPDSETETWAGFPKADPNVHEVWSANFDEAEILGLSDD